MQLINANGLALLGPGSEWFWTMAQFLALLGTGLAIFRQLRVQRGANELAVVTRLADELMAEQMMRHQLAALIHVAEKRPGMSASLGLVTDWFDATADVIR
ncbi:MAG: hypothetical protein ABIU97_07180, partial [Dehalococcoidia bacterium]